LSFSFAIFWAAGIDAMFSSSLCKKLQFDVTHRGRIADNVASSREEHVDANTVQ